MTDLRAPQRTDNVAANLPPTPAAKPPQTAKP